MFRACVCQNTADCLGCGTLSDDARDITTQSCRLLGKLRRLFGCRRCTLLSTLRRVSPAHCAMLPRPCDLRDCPIKTWQLMANSQLNESSFAELRSPLAPFANCGNARPVSGLSTQNGTRGKITARSLTDSRDKALERAFRKLRFHFWFGTPWWTFDRFLDSL